MGFTNEADLQLNVEGAGGFDHAHEGSGGVLRIEEAANGAAAAGTHAFSKLHFANTLGDHGFFEFSGKHGLDRASLHVGKNAGDCVRRRSANRRHRVTLPTAASPRSYGIKRLRDDNAELAISADTHASMWTGEDIDYGTCIDYLV